jgi:hypothetical protein
MVLAGQLKDGALVSVHIEGGTRKTAFSGRLSPMGNRRAQRLLNPSRTGLGLSAEDGSRDPTDCINCLIGWPTLY